MPDIDVTDKPGADNDTALKMGMEEEAMEFVKQGAEIYHRACRAKQGEWLPEPFF